MIDCIADQVSHWFSQHIENALIQVSVLAAHDEFDFFAAGLCDVAHHAWEAAEKLLHRDHADLHYRLLQIVQYSRLKCHCVCEFSAQGILDETFIEFVDTLIQHALADNEFADQIQHRVNSLGVHTQE